MSGDDLRAHLEFFGELGVDGFRVEPVWRARRSDEPAAPSESPESIPVQVFSSSTEAAASTRSESISTTPRWRSRPTQVSEQTVGIPASIRG